MILPIGDSPNPRYTPLVTWGLIAANVLLFLALLPLASRPVDPTDPAVHDYIRAIAAERPVTDRDLAQMLQHLTAYDILVFEHGARPAHLELRDVLASMFLHGGWMHLIGNMLFLWIYGDNVEHRLGRAWFLVFYLATGAVAVLGDALIRHGSDIPSVGASGAISGVLGAYFLFFPRNRVRLFVVFFPFLVDVVEVPARLVLGAYVLLDNLLPMLINGGGTGVSHGAHLGGFFAGIGAAAAVGKLVTGGPTRLPRDPGDTGSDYLGAMQKALAEGRGTDAAAFFFALPRGTARELVTPRAKRVLGLQLEREGNAKAALRVYEQLALDHPKTPEAVDALLGAGRILLEVLGRPAEAYAALRTLDDRVFDAEQRAEAARLVEQLRRVTKTRPKGPWH